MLEDGTWSVDFSPYDVTLGMGANVSLPDEDWDRSQADVYLQIPTISGRLTDGGISLQSWTPGSDVTVTVGDTQSFVVHIGRTALRSSIGAAFRRRSRRTSTSWHGTARRRKS